jgi:hypothetical protein
LCGLLSFRGGRLWPSTREKFRQYKFSHSSCQVFFCLCSMRLVESIAEHISFCLLSYSSIRCARPLLRRMHFMVTSVLRRSFNSRKRGTVHSCASSRPERFQIVYSLLWWRISITHCRAFKWAETFSDSSARYMSILFQSNRNYSKFCACSGCTLYLTHMRRRTAPLVYLKFCAQIGGFSWGTHDWSRGWNSRQGDGVKTRRPRHLQWACPLDNHSKICQLKCYRRSWSHGCC